ncbi:serine/threonine-protein kinase [Gemmatimonas aurantiaca]|uniref:serine/threonine-protein kinase n=1 Tax=Gemmatimonas aurantiaca TaxID=173480 RepID=UPI00301D96C6
MSETPLTPTRLHRLRALFDAAIELPVGERAAYLASACEDDPTLQTEVEELLAAVERSGDTWDHPVGAAVAGAMAEGLGEGTRGDRYAAGGRIGVYEITRLIGMGGMGAVYEGVRVDDQFRKRVALKFLRRGGEGDLAIRRFRYERQILANLNHRNIAALLDGGVTEDGQPYIVMEYVEGEPLTTYANTRRLDLRGRVALLRQVCAAVQHAHQNFVVHRDLKPGNILVTADGSVKLLDFGIARLTRDAEGLEQLPATQGGALAFTPEYASPEQARGMPVAASSDIYSLGIIAAELLSGARPYTVQGLLFAEMQTVIVQTPAAVPSTQVTDASATSFGMRAPRLRRALQGDLDAIILQALRKEPERRYGSVEQFSRDLQRWLDGLPVSAQRDTLAYRAGKFVRRRRLEVTALGLIGVSLVGGIVATSRQARRAELERNKMEQVNSFLSNMLSAVDPELGGTSVTVAQVLSQAAKNIEQEHLEPEVEAQIRHTLGQTYYGLSLYDSAETHARRAWDLRRKEYGDLDQRTSMSLSYVVALTEARGAFAQAESLAMLLVDRQRRMPKDQYNPTELATALDNLGRTIEQQGRLDEALAVKLQAIALRRTIKDDSSSLAALPYTLNSVSVSYTYQGEFAKAESLLVEALDVESRVHGPTSFNMGNLSRSYASLLDEMGYQARADTMIRRSVRILTDAAGPTHYETLRSKSMLAQLRYAAADMPGTIAAAREVVPEIGRGMPESDATAGSVLQALGLALDSLRQFVAADTFLLRSRQLRRTYMPPEHWAVANADAVYGYHLGRWGRRQEAERLMRGAYDRLVKTRGADALVTKRVAVRLAEFFEATGRAAEAKQWRDRGT